jgi:hypothetical protein
MSAAVVPDPAARSTSGGLSVATWQPVAAVAVKRSAMGESKPTVPAHRMYPVGPAGDEGLVFRGHLTEIPAARSVHLRTDGGTYARQCCRDFIY